MNWGIFIANILIHVGVMALFLTTFFFTIASSQEAAIVEKQMNFIMDDFIGGTFKAMDPNVKKTIISNIDKNLDKAKNNLKQADEDTKKNNDKITKKAFTFVGILVGVIIVIVVILGFYLKWEAFYIRYLFFSSLASLIFVAIAETAFLFLIPKGYDSVDPNKIKKTIVDNLLT